MWRHLAAILLVSSTVFAQERLRASVDHSTVRVGETVQLTMAFEGAGSGVSTPELTELENLQVAGGPFSSFSTSIVNGRVSASSSYTYVLRAKKVGPARIGAAKAIYKGKEYTSNPISINVVAGTASNTGSSSDSPDVFIRLIPDKREAYVGEQITLSYKLYFAVQMTNPEFTRLPKATGFWVEDIPLPRDLPLSDEVANGKAYKTAIIRKSALFPTTEGELDVEPLVINTRIQRTAPRRSRDPFDIFNDPFFQLGRQWEALEVTSPSITLRAKALPSGGIPTGFNGTVGMLKARAFLDRTSCKTNEGVTLTVEIEGTGNIKMLPEPQLSFPPDIQRFDPEVTDDIRRNQGVIQGKKTFKYIVIPRAPGTQVISSWTYVFFDPQRQSYLTISVPELTMQVERGEAGSSFQPGVPVATKRGVESVGTDISFAKTRAGNFTALGGVPHRQFGFWLIAAGPWILLAGSVVIVRRQERLAGAAGFIRRRALREALRAVDHAEKAAKGGATDDVLRHLDRATDQIAFSATGVSPDTGTSDAVTAAWKEGGLDRELLERIQNIRSECDMMRFGSGGRSADGCRRLIAQTRDVISKFESQSGRRS